MAIKNTLNLRCKTNTIKFKLGSKNAEMYSVPLPKSDIFKEYKNGLEWWNQDYRLTCPLLNKVPKVVSDLDNDKKFIQAFCSPAIQYFERKNTNQIFIKLFFALYMFDPNNTKYFLYFIENINFDVNFSFNSCKEIKFPIVVPLKISGMYKSGRTDKLDETNGFVYQL